MLSEARDIEAAKRPEYTWDDAGDPSVMINHEGCVLDLERSYAPGLWAWRRRTAGFYKDTFDQGNRALVHLFPFLINLFFPCRQAPYYMVIRPRHV